MWAFKFGRFCGETMLILGRKPNEEIIIDHEIRVKVVSISKGVVKIGIIAADDVSIYRAEIYDSVQSDSSLKQN